MRYSIFASIKSKISLSHYIQRCSIVEGMCIPGHLDKDNLNLTAFHYTHTPKYDLGQQYATSIHIFQKADYAYNNVAIIGDSLGYVYVFLDSGIPLEGQRNILDFLV